MRFGQNVRFLWRGLAVYLAILGPGLITASAGNDAPGIATYSLVGSTYGYQLLWLIALVAVGQAIVNEMAARMGAVTSKGTADLIRERFGVRVTAFAMFCLLLANLGTTVAQFAGVAAATELLGISRYITVPLSAVLIVFLVLRGTYRHVERVLLILSMFALSYIISTFLVHPPWGQVLRQTITIQLERSTDFVLTVLATIGTTITPWGVVYMQASIADKGVSLAEYRYTRLDVVTGALFGSVVSAFIVICTAATLFERGIQVETAEQAAMALEPLAGAAARYLFSIGLVGASILAASVLPLSTTYAICEAFGWERGLNYSGREAPVFYGLYVATIASSALVVLVPGIPLFPLMWLSQALNAILLPVLLFLVLKLVNDRHVMGKWTNSRLQNLLAWGLTVAISAVAVVLFLSPWLLGT